MCPLLHRGEVLRLCRPDLSLTSQATRASADAQKAWEPTGMNGHRFLEQGTIQLSECGVTETKDSPFFVKHTVTTHFWVLIVLHFMHFWVFAAKRKKLPKCLHYTRRILGQEFRRDWLSQNTTCFIATLPKNNRQGGPFSTPCKGVELLNCFVGLDGYMKAQMTCLCVFTVSSPK